MDFIEAVEKSLGRKAKKNFLPLQPGDVPNTWADVDDLVENFGYAPSVTVQEGVEKFIRWYTEFYDIR